jgi:hypothetical protein
MFPAVKNSGKAFKILGRLCQFIFLLGFTTTSDCETSGKSFPQNKKHSLKIQLSLISPSPVTLLIPACLQMGESPTSWWYKAQTWVKYVIIGLPPK